jgi:hypothetical protein
MAGEQFDHTMAVGVANGGRRVDDDRARLFHSRQTIENRRALTHDEQVGGRRFNDGVRGDQLDVEAPFRQTFADPSHDGGVIIDAAGRVGGLAQDADTGHGRIHARALSGQRSPACSAA